MDIILEICLGYSFPRYERTMRDTIGYCLDAPDLGEI